MKNLLKLCSALAALTLAFGFASCNLFDDVDDDDTPTQTVTNTGGTTGGQGGNSGTTTDPSAPETPAVEIDPEVAENVVELPATQALDYIENMTESGTVRVTGELTSADLDTLRTALQNKGTGTADGDVRIALDLSAATVTGGWFSIKYAPSLVSLSLPSGLEEVDIMNCPSLVSLTFSDDVRTIMMMGCNSLQSVTLGKGTCAFAGVTFQDCPALTEIKLSDTVTDYIVEDGVLYTADKKTLACYPCGKPAATFAIPDGVEKIDNCAFANNRNLTHVTMPSTVTTMGFAAFSGCSALETVVLSGFLTSIEANSFNYSPHLSSIVIPESVVFIRAGAFYASNALSRVEFAAPTGWYETSAESHEKYAGDGSPITVSNTATMAEKLRTTSVYGGKSLVKP